MKVNLTILETTVNVLRERGLNVHAQEVNNAIDYIRENEMKIPIAVTPFEEIQPESVTTTEEESEEDDNEIS